MSQESMVMQLYLMVIWSHQLKTRLIKGAYSQKSEPLWNLQKICISLWQRV